MSLRGFTFKGTHSDNYGLLVTRVSRSIIPQLTEKIVTIPNRPGGYWFGNDMGVREFQIDVTLIGSTDTDLFQKARDVAKWLIDDQEQPLVFDAEPDKTYYAIFTGQTNLDTLFSVGSTTLTFICPDPYAYGPEYETEPITFSPFSFTPTGTEKTSPVIVAEFTQPSTYFSIATQDQYIHIGQPDGADETTLPREEIMIDDDCTSTTNWQTQNQVEGGGVQGAITPDAWAFRPTSYGAGSTWHGPALKRMATNPAQDFRFEGIIGFFAAQQNEMGRIEFYLLGQNNETIGKLAIKDIWKDETTMVEARVGDAVSGRYIIEHIGKRYYKKKKVMVKKKVNGKMKTVPQEITEGFSEHSDFYGKLKMERIGQNWKASVIRMDQNTGRELNRLEVRFFDKNNQYQTPIAGVAVHFGQYGTNPFINKIFVTQIRLTKYNQDTSPSVPEIFVPGDEVLIDCESGAIYKNGVVWMEELNVGSDFFDLEGGQDHTIAFEPHDKCSLKIYHRGRYL